MFKIINRIDDYINSKGWTYYELSQQTGISSNTIYNWKNRGSVPTIPMLEKVCEAFKISIEEFFCGVGSDLSEEERMILKEWHLLSSIEKDCIWNLLKTFKFLKSL